MKKAMLRLSAILIAAVILLSCTSCASTVKAVELSGGYRRNETGEAVVDEGFAAAMADFSFRLFRETLSRDGENGLVSPLSAALCLALAANGADGETLAQMEAAFGMDMDVLNESLYAFTASLYSDEKCQVSIANSIWIRDDDGLNVKEDFLQTNADRYAAEVFKAPFDKSTVKDINRWAEQATDGMIDSILREIGKDAVLYLINALAFDAEWSNKYEKSDVHDRTFTNADGSIKTVEMMMSTEHCLLTVDGGVGFAKDYRGGAYSFAALLPDEGADIYDFAASLNGEKWIAMWNSRGGGVKAGLPIFSYEADYKLNDALEAMGMTDMFIGNKADFTRMAESKDGNIYCSMVRQSTVIDVNTAGTRAAAVTIAEMKMYSFAESFGVQEVILDRPFVYAIVDNTTGLPLFVGIVTTM